MLSLEVWREEAWVGITYVHCWFDHRWVASWRAGTSVSSWKRPHGRAPHAGHRCSVRPDSRPDHRRLSRVRARSDHWCCPGVALGALRRASETEPLVAQTAAQLGAASKLLTHWPNY